jgi:hypothetical protein
MTINWQDLLTSIGTTAMSGAVIVGAVAWFSKTIVSHGLSRDIESFKSQLKASVDGETERLKNALQMSALEHQVRFSRLHEKRAIVIDEVYQRLVDLQNEYGATVLHRADGKETEQKMYDTYVFLQKRRIYLPLNVCELLQSFLDLMWDNTIKLSQYKALPNPNAGNIERLHESIAEGFKLLRERVPAARRGLEDEFRSLLGEG